MTSAVLAQTTNGWRTQIIPQLGQGQTRMMWYNI
jgi:hypothetical protein